MINYFLKKSTKNIFSIPPSIEDIIKSRKILFSIFSRYGDTVISLVVIREFVELYPEKEYLILCPRQMEPYVTQILPNIECIAFNKRNLYAILKVRSLLKKRMFNIGFNPWSHGHDSSYFISFCAKFIFYKEFEKPKGINHYQVVRSYLQLPKKKWFIKDLILKDSYKTILICPQSTDKKRSLSIGEVDRLILNFNKVYNEPQITIASMDRAYLRNDCNKFIFNKSDFSSKQFINLVDKSALIVCSDSAPLHIALALKKDLMAFFKVSMPETALNSGSYLKISECSQ